MAGNSDLVTLLRNAEEQLHTATMLVKQLQPLDREFTKRVSYAWLMTATALDQARKGNHRVPGL